MSGETVAQLHEAVRGAYPHHIHLTEVRDATGFDAIRSADAMAIGMYSSRGREVRGFEMKVSRTDWLKELKQPDKAESLARFCNAWALIAPTENIVHAGELPKPWGFGVPHRRRSNAALKLHWIVTPPELQPAPYDLVFLTALLAAARKQPVTEAEAAISAAYKRGQESAAMILKNERQAKERAEKTIDEFGKKLGVHISRWSTDEDLDTLAKEFAEFRARKREERNATESLESLLVQADRIAHGLRRVLHPDLYESTRHRLPLR